MQDLAYSTDKAGNLTDPDLDLSQAGRYLDQAVTANPRDLKTHVQRIHFHWQRRKRDAVFGALVDMFLILGPAGAAIRNRLLRHCGDLLSSEQRVFLLERLDSGLLDGTTLPAGTQTTLNRNSEKTMSSDADITDGIQDAINEDTLTHDNESIAFLLAEEYRRHGWDDLAKGLLQELVATDPDNMTARQTLLQLH